jgi:gentisate 1,2-dioxygenase
MAVEIRDMESYQQYLKDKNLTIRMGGEAPPKKTLLPYQWKWDDIEPAVVASGQLVRLAADFEDRGGVVRRDTHFHNPRNSPDANFPLRLGIQYVGPGEQAISHRHSAQATRFVIKGAPDAYTLVNGEPFPLHDGDLVITPHLNFHGHVNNSDTYVLWLDGLHGAGVGATFNEEWPETMETVQYDRVGEALKTMGGHLRIPNQRAGRARPYRNIVHPLGPAIMHDETAEHPPGYRYTWEQTSAALGAMRDNEDEPDPFDCYTVTYTHPLTGGPTLPTAAWEMTMLTPGFKGRDHRHNSSVIYYCFQGRGVLTVEGERFEWSKGDFIELPAFMTHRHENPFGDDAFIAGWNDWPLQKLTGNFYYQEF